MANIIGTLDDDRDATALIGTANADVIRGLAGNDQLSGRDGQDELRGGGGDDELDGGAGADRLFGGAGFDVITPGPGNDSVDGGDDFDFVDYQDASGGVTVDLDAGTATGGGIGNDTLISIAGAFGSAFADTLSGSGEFNILRGRGGDDILDGRGSSNRVDYQDSPASVTVDLDAGIAADGFGGTDTIINVDEVHGSSFDDVLRGNDNFNTFNGLAGNDLIDGRGSGDRVDYRESPASVTVDLAAGTAADGFGTTDTISNVDEVRGSNFDDVLRGNDNFNAFEGLAGNDIIDGINLIEGSDADYGRSPAGIVADLEAGTIEDGFGTTDTVTNIDGVRGSAFDDVIVGSSTIDFETFQGRAGNDRIDGNGGESNRVAYFDSPAGVTVDLAAGTAEDGFGTTDTFTGINGVSGTDFDDQITGGAGAFEFFRPRGGDDFVDGGPGEDRLDYRSAPDSVTVDLFAGVADDGRGGTDTFVNIEAARGGNSDDQLLGNGGDNTLRGRGGDDLLDGRKGADDLRGEDGNDTIRGRAGEDFVLGGAGDDLIEGGSAADNLNGEAGNDQLFGNRGADFIDGGDGDDLLAGGSGPDTLVGGAGADVFRYANATQGVDTIQDLTAEDAIDIENVLSGFDGDPTGFVQLVDAGPDALLQVDPNGGGNNFIDLALIINAAGTSVDDLIDGGQLILPESG